MEAHIDGLCVLLEGEHDLWRAVPAGGDILGHEARLAPVRLGRLGRAREAEVADLEVAVGVKEQIGRLEITVNHISRVERLDRAQRLVGEVLDVVVRESLGTDHPVQVRLHQLLDKVHLFEVGQRTRLDNVHNRDNLPPNQTPVSLPPRPQRPRTPFREI